MYPAWSWTLLSCIPAAIWLESRLHNPSLPDVLTIFWVHIVVIALTFILRTLHTQELVADGLEQRLDSLEQRLEQEVETGGSDWLVVTDSLEQRLDSLEQHLEEEVKTGGSLRHRRPGIPGHSSTLRGFSVRMKPLRRST